MHTRLRPFVYYAFLRHLGYQPELMDTTAEYSTHRRPPAACLCYDLHKRSIPRLRVTARLCGAELNNLHCGRLAPRCVPLPTNRSHTAVNATELPQRSRFHFRCKSCTLRKVSSFCPPLTLNLPHPHPSPNAAHVFRLQAMSTAGWKLEYRSQL